MLNALREIMFTEQFSFPIESLIFSNSCTQKFWMISGKN